MCLHPIHAWFGKYTSEKGVRHIYFTPPPNFDDAIRNYIPLPCGKCIGCLDDRRKVWINRLLLEYDNCRCGSFITLTYNEKYVPERPLKSHLQKFIKRFRNIPRDLNFPPLPPDFKYFACGECGCKGGRPHYHALLFGVDLLADIWQPYIATFKDGTPLFSSRVLEAKWPFGFCTVDTITPGRCKYIAKYTMKQEGQEHSFTLKSPRLGVREFFDIERHGRNVEYRLKSSDSLQRLQDGNIHVSSDKGRLTNIRIPMPILSYLERTNPFDLSVIKALRQLEAQRFFNNFDKVAYFERLCSETQKQKIKRKLHK